MVLFLLPSDTDLTMFMGRFFIFFIVFKLFSMPSIGQKIANSDICGKKLAIKSAQAANKSYQYAKMAYSVNTKELAFKNMDSSVTWLELSIQYIDSALALAADSELMAIDLSNMAKKNANKALKSGQAWYSSSNKYELAHHISFMSANATTDAYHASFYFENCKNEPKKEEKKPETPNQVTKLDVDQVLFSLLDEQLTEKADANSKDLDKLKELLKKTKDPAQVAKLKEKIQKLEKELAAVNHKNQETKEKLNSINQQIEERHKNGATNNANDESVFSKSMKQPQATDEWNKQVLMDSDIPSGLVYQVQIGVYKKNVVPETFKGLTPIFGKTVGDGVSYSTGMFEKYKDAQQAKDYVKSIGLSDAFIIAFYNKKKITLAEAAKLEK